MKRERRRRKKKKKRRSRLRWMNMSPETENHDEYTRSETVTVIQESENVYIREIKKKRMTGGFRIKVPVASPENDEVSGE